MLANHPRLRLGIYLVSLAGAAGAPILAVVYPDLAAAVTTSAGVLAAAAGVTAISNLSTPGE